MGDGGWEGSPETEFPPTGLGCLQLQTGQGFHVVIPSTSRVIRRDLSNEALMTPAWRGTCFIENTKFRPNMLMSPLDTFEII